MIDNQRLNIISQCLKTPLKKIRIKFRKDLIKNKSYYIIKYNKKILYLLNDIYNMYIFKDKLHTKYYFSYQLNPNEIYSLKVFKRGPPEYRKIWLNKKNNDSPYIKIYNEERLIFIIIHKENNYIEYKYFKSGLFNIYMSQYYMYYYKNYNIYKFITKQYIKQLTNKFFLLFLIFF